MIAAVIQEGTARGQGNAVMVAHWAAAVLYNGLGRYEEAAAAARRSRHSTDISPLLTMWALFELDRGRRAHRRHAGLARDALDELAATTQPAGSGFALGIEARCRALLADGAAAEASYREAIEQLDRTRHTARACAARICSSASGCAARVVWARRASGSGRPRRCSPQIGMEAFADRARARAGRGRGEAAQARSRGARGPHPAGGADRPARRRRAHERGDRRPAVPQSAHRRVAPAQGVRQARDRLAQRPLRRPAAAGTGRCSLLGLTRAPRRSPRRAPRLP